MAPATSSIGPGEFPEALSVKPLARPFSGVVALPGSKSITNRALLIAALARGQTQLSNALFCDDSHYLAEALKALGVAVQPNPESRSFIVEGAAGPLPGRQAEIYLGNAGTATRFLTGALGLSRGHYVIDGNHRMRERPIGDLVRALRELGVTIEDTRGFPPVTIGKKSWAQEGEAPRAIPFQGGSVKMNGHTSSQFISAVLMAAPLVGRNTEVVIEGECVSRPYLDITLQVMQQFGAVARADEGRGDGRLAFSVRGGTGYKGRSYPVEGDASSASYFLAAAALSGGKIRVEGVGRDSVQGDARFADVLARMGCHVKKDSDVLSLSCGDPLRGVREDCNEMPDIVPTLTVVALFARGKTVIRNVPHLRHKESDRIASVATELRKLGARIQERPDGLEIEPTELQGGTLETWGDHRLAMAFSLVGMMVPDVVIRDPAVVEKSFPEYFQVITGLGAEVVAR